MWHKYFNYVICSMPKSLVNKAILMNLKAVTRLVIFLKLDSFLVFFSLYELEIRWMNLKNNRAPPLCYVTLFPLFQSHQWIQSGVTARKWSNWQFFVLCDLEIWQITLKMIVHLFYATSSFERLVHFVAISQSKLLQLNSSENQLFFVLYDLDIWWKTFKNYRAPLLCRFKLCASFRSHPSV